MERCLRCGRHEDIPTAQFVKFDLKVNYLCGDCWRGFNQWFNAKDRIQYIHNEPEEDKTLIVGKGVESFTLLPFVPGLHSGTVRYVCKNTMVWGNEDKEGDDEDKEVKHDRL